MSEAPISREGQLLTFDLDTVCAVAALLRESQLGEICIETTNEDAAPARLLLRRAANIYVPAAVVETNPETAESVSEGAEAPDKSTPPVPITAVTSPAVGVFHPAKTPAVVGDAVKAGQIIGCVESMRVPNEVVAPVAGQIREAQASDGQGVEYGQPLFVIEESR